MDRQQPRSHGATPRWLTGMRRWGRLLHVFALLGLLFLPVQMRAGAEAAHSHSLLQLLIDAGDGEIDHHEPAGDHHHEHHTGPGDECQADPDIPVAEESRPAGSVSMLTTLVAALIIPANNSRALWPVGHSWRGHMSRPESPPPRCPC